jgi:hypothetical protein
MPTINDRQATRENHDIWRPNVLEPFRIADRVCIIDSFLSVGVVKIMLIGPSE